MDYKIKDIKLAEQGERQLEWAEAHMPVLMAIRKELSASRPLKGLKVAMLLHVTKETGVLARTVAAAGGEVFLGGSNPLSTQDDVAAALANSGMCVYAWKGQSDSDYERNMRVILDARPDVVMDDGADLHAMVHKEYGKLRIIGGTEETTTGITRLKSMEEEKVLRYPVIAVNNAYTKYLFDNRYGTGQSGVDGVIRATNIMISGKVAAVAGYGWVGRGVAMRLHGLGARVIVTEVNPFRALEAVMDGYEVRKMSEAAKNADLFITATGDKNVITIEHMLSMKDGAIMANVGHFDVEIDVRELAKRAKKTRLIREHLREYTLQKREEDIPPCGGKAREPRGRGGPSERGDGPQLCKPGPCGRAHSEGRQRPRQQGVRGLPRDRREDSKAQARIDGNRDRCAYGGAEGVHEAVEVRDVAVLILTLRPPRST
jgi:adenosylhomocysteinase (EC 3.3.1.1)